MSVDVLDAPAIIAYVSGEPGEKIVAALLTDPTATCYAHTINLCEVYYGAIRKTNAQRARQTIHNLLADGVIERKDMNHIFWRRVGELKARGRISLPDCCCISLAPAFLGKVHLVLHQC